MFVTSEPPKYSNSNSQNLCFDFFNDTVTNNLRQILDSGAIDSTFDQAKNHNKRFGEFEFEYFGGSDVTNKLDVSYASRLYKLL